MPRSASLLRQSPKTSQRGRSAASRWISRMPCCPASTIDAVHGPTGTQYSAITDAERTIPHLQRSRRRSIHGHRGAVRLPIAGAGKRHRAAGRDDRAGFQAGAGERQPKTITVEAEVDPDHQSVADRTCREHLDRTVARICRPCRAASRTSRAHRRISRRSRSTPSPARSRSPDATTDTTASRLTAQSTTTCSACPPRARRPARPNRSRSASTPSRSCSCSSRPTTSGRVVSRAAASTRSPGPGPTRFSGTAYYLGRSESFVGDYTDPIHREPVASLRRVQREARRRQHRRADSCRTERSSSATSK